jgi:putative transposase
MNNTSLIKIEQGTLVSYKAKPARVRRVISLESAVIQYLETDEIERARIAELRPITEAENPSEKAAATPDLAEFTDGDWEAARKIHAIIAPLMGNPNRKRSDVELAASQAGVHPATIYEWMKDFVRTGHMSALVPMKRGRKQGEKRLEPEVEAVLDDIIETKFLDSQRLRPAAIIEAVNERCRDLKLKAPHPNTIRNRLADIPRNVALRARGFKDAADKLSKPLLGKFPGATKPLAVVQIDHTKLDVIVVHEVSRKPWKRPWLTVAIDVYSRMIVGVYLSMDAPSAVAGGICLSMGMLPKNEYLASLGLRGTWPVYGKIGTVHSDNGKDFKGAVLKRACDEHGIDMQLRPVKTPNYGGHIESMIGNINREMHKLPGTTFSKPHLREGYDSKKKAVLTLKEVEAHVVEWIVNQYHQNRHSELKMPPIRKWEQAIFGDGTNPGCGVPLMFTDPERLKIDFLPFEERTIQNYGVQIDTIGYYDEVLNRWINAPDPKKPSEKRKFIFRVDPRHLSKIWFFDPEANQYYEIPYRDTSHPDVNRAEYREEQRKLRDQGLNDVDENLVFDSIKRNRERVEQAEAETKATKRGASKKKPAAKKFFSSTEKTPAVPIVTASVPAASASRPQVVDDLDDLFAAPTKRFNVRVDS